MRDDRLELEQVVAAERDVVWRAWTTERGLATWWWSGWDDTTYDVDLRVGGRYRIAAPGAGIAVSGEYVELLAPERLVMTWVWEDDGVPGPVERVEVDLSAVGDSTTVRVRHTGPWTTPEPAANYAIGWRHVLAALADTASAGADGRE